MRDHYEAQLTTLNTEMIQMGALCEDAISSAIQALLEDDAAAGGDRPACGFFCPENDF